jgi:phosphoglycerol transferase
MLHLIKKISSKSIGYIGAAIISSLILWTLYGLWHVDLRYPMTPLVHDAVATQALIFKALVDSPWYLDNARLGAPFALNVRDFAALDVYVLYAAKLLTVFTKNHNLIRNLVALTSFPLITLTSLYVMRRLGVRYTIALAASLLYAFSSYHHLRLGVHLVLAVSCFAVPIATLLILDLFENKPLFFAAGSSWRKIIWSKSRSTWGAVVACIVIGTTGMVYYPFFTCYLLLVAGAVATAHTRSAMALIRSLCLVSVICLAVAFCLAPRLLQNWVHGHTGVISRPPADAELYGLKIAQLVIPGGGHRLDVLKQLAEYYNNRAPLVTENHTAYLGLIGVVGFLYLLFAGLRGNVQDARIRGLSTVNLAALLLGTIGGFSSIISFTLSSTIRSYNRISVYIGFFALLSVALLLEKAAARWVSTIYARSLLFVSLAVAVWLGVCDQYVFVDKYDEIKRDYVAFGVFISRIERSVPPNSSIYQYPYYPFNDIRDYSLLKPYLHSKTLRWSYGSCEGRRGDLWHSRVAAMPTERAMEALVLAGFAGVYVARDEYKDRGASIETALEPLLGKASITSASSQAAFYSLRRFAQRFTASLGPGEFERRRSELLDRPFLGWGHGFYGPNVHDGLVNAWGTSRNQFIVENPASSKRRLLFNAMIRVANAPANVSISGEHLEKSFIVGPNGYRLSEKLEVTMGTHYFRIETDSQRAKSGINVFEHDPRVGVEDASLETLPN